MPRYLTGYTGHDSDSVQRVIQRLVDMRGRCSAASLRWLWRCEVKQVTPSAADFLLLLLSRQ